MLSRLERYFFEKINVDEEEKYHNAEPGFVVFTQKYHFGPGIKSLGVVETIHGISRKNLVIVTSNGQVIIKIYKMFNNLKGLFP